MKTHNIKSQTMRTLLFILLFISSFAYAQPPINTPSSYDICDDNNDGISVFDLQIKKFEILGPLNSNDYTLSYHATLTDANFNANPLPLLFVNSSPNNQTIYVRVEENANTTNYSTTTLNLFVKQSPIVTLDDLITCSNSLSQLICNVLPSGSYSYYWYLNGMLIVGNNTNTFIPTISGTYSVTAINNATGCSGSDFAQVTINEAPTVTVSGGGNYVLNSSNVAATFTCSGGIPPYVINYYINGGAIQNITTAGTVNSASIPIPTNLLGSYGINTVLISDGAGCVQSISDTEIFNIVAFPIINPTPLNVCDDNNDGISVFDLQTKNAEILGALNPNDYTVSYHISDADANLNANALPLLYNNSVPNNQTIYVRVKENASANYVITTLSLLVNPKPILPLVIPSIVVYENPCDGFAVFDLSTITGFFLNGSSSNTISYHNSLADAELLINPFPNSFSNSSNPQTVWVRVENPVTGCYSISSFQFKVLDPSQVIYIPDANFKAKLLAADVTNAIASTTNSATYPDTYNKIDANNDGEIQRIEAASVTLLNVSNSNISDLTGIEEFISLRVLKCKNNQITNLNINQSNHLGFLECQDNNITSLDVNNKIFLQHLFCNNNHLTSLTLNNLPSLTTLYCGNNQLTGSLDVSNFTQLSYFACENNQLSTLNVSNLVNLLDLYCQNNHLTSLVTTSLPNLGQLDCSANLLTSLNVNGFNLLQILKCGSNALTSLDVSQLSNLTNLDCNSNQISTLLTYPNVLTNLNYNSNQLPNLDFTNLTTLNFLNCANNQIIYLDLSHFTNLMGLLCGNNLLSTLDYGYLHNLLSLDISNNYFNNLDVNFMPSLGVLMTQNTLITTLDVSNSTHLNSLVCGGDFIQTIYAKNGVDEYLDLTTNCPNLQFICADETQLSAIQTILTNIGSNAVVNSYCSFTPGGYYNTISGNIKYDGNNNGCDANDLQQPNIRVNINDGTNTGASFTNNLGNYSYFTQAGSFVLTLDVENPIFFNFTPTPSTISFADNNNNLATQDFCIRANGEHHDVEMVIVPITPARPGFDAVYKLVYKNLGNQVENIVAPNFYFNDSVLDYISSSIAPTSSVLGYLQWSLPSLLPFQSGEITITFHVNSPTDVPSVNIGDILAFSSIIDVVTDENWSDNNFTFNQTVVGSFDPNDITCLEGNNVAPSEIGEYLHYVINFENTGNYPAENVVVKTIVDTSKFDINSLQLLNSSNPVDARITGNVVEFIYNNIQLSGPGGHGHVLLKIKTKDSLVTGDSVDKRADIFFDYNAPIDTGMETTVFQNLSNSVFEHDDAITVSPNPTKGYITINSDFNIEKVELYDFQGRVLEAHTGNSKIIDITEKSNGVYFLKITTEKGSKIEKVVKE